MKELAPEKRHGLDITLSEFFSTPEFDALEQETQYVSVSPCAARHWFFRNQVPAEKMGQAHIWNH